MFHTFCWSATLPFPVATQLEFCIAFACNCHTASNALRHADSALDANCFVSVFCTSRSWRMCLCALRFYQTSTIIPVQRIQRTPPEKRILSSFARIRKHTFLLLVCISFLLSPFFLLFICFPQKKKKKTPNQKRTKKKQQITPEMNSYNSVCVFGKHVQFVKSLHRHNVDFHT